MASIKTKYFCTNKCFVNIFQVFKFVIDHPATQLFSLADNAQELRNKWERIWMARLNTYVPYGMNIQD